MICAKNYEKLSKFITVTAKILSIFFFWTLCIMAPSSRPQTKPDNLGCESTCTCCQSLHLPFIFITQPESWYSFYHPTDSRRL